MFARDAPVIKTDKSLPSWNLTFLLEISRVNKK